jgi:hypothetical protein
LEARKAAPTRMRITAAIREPDRMRLPFRRDYRCTGGRSQPRDRQQRASRIMRETARLRSPRHLNRGPRWMSASPLMPLTAPRVAPSPDRRSSLADFYSPRPTFPGAAARRERAPAHPLSSLISLPRRLHRRDDVRAVPSRRRPR